ncbi:uncharacterized protein LOC122265286 [Penaeus japonicus]|uniref:uncharacterized protein LOC122265286 n=1 Tax=Penaeus japonicus TaxID=27405 RepID=UPI001C70CBAE|nr:uncharacterized protein LOC122265286 [Penaeus japonicus]
MLLKKASHDTRKQTAGGKMQIAHSEEIRQSLDVLDRVLSEFDDIETDTNDDSVAADVADALEHADKSSEHEDAGVSPPPVDRSLKPARPGAAPQDPRAPPRLRELLAVQP